MEAESIKLSTGFNMELDEKELLENTPTEKDKNAQNQETMMPPSPTNKTKQNNHWELMKEQNERLLLELRPLTADRIEKKGKRTKSQSPVSDTDKEGNIKNKQMSANKDNSCFASKPLQALP